MSVFVVQPALQDVTKENLLSDLLDLERCVPQMGNPKNLVVKISTFSALVR